MKYLLRVFLFHVFALWIVSQVIPGLVIDGNWLTVFFAGFILSLLMTFVRPLLKILFVPINIITFGLLSWLVNVIVIYIFSILVTQIQIVSWTFPGWSWAGFALPRADVSYVPSLIIISIAVTFITNLLHEISEV